jgi:ferredoxin
MPHITVDQQTFEVSEGKRLVLAIEEDAGVHIGHRCGGFARCTTCRVQFHSGEPDTMTRAEFNKLQERELYGSYRLSCQIVCDHDMQVQPVMTLENQDWTDTGPPPEVTVTPEARWYPIAELEAEQLDEAKTQTQ